MGAVADLCKPCERRYGDKKIERAIEMTKHDYVKRVVKKLNCPQDKRADIEKQLLSDIEIALGEGRQLDEILTEMGEPEALAKEFNENFGDGEKSSGKKGRGVKVILIIAVVLAVLAVLAYWALPKTRDIGDSGRFTAYVVEQSSRAVIDAFSKGDYDTLESYYSKEMQEAVTRQMLEDFKPVIGDDWGEYSGVGTAYMVEVSQRGKTYVVVQMNASYANVSVTYTLTFNSEMQLVGFYMK